MLETRLGIVAAIPLLLLTACGDDSLVPTQRRVELAEPAGPSGPTSSTRPNRPPVAVAALAAGFDATTIQPGDSVGLDATASYDPDGDPLTYSWHLLAAPEESTTSVVSPDTATPSLLLDVEGVFTVALTVTDPGGLEDQTRLSLSADAVYSDVPFDVEVVDFTLSSSSCYYVSPVLSGSLTIDRADPDIKFHFESSTFVGTINEQNEFVVALEQEFDYTDGCHWGALDRIEGRFSTPDAFEADHDYSEWVKTGTACASACWITSHLIGTRM